MCIRPVAKAKRSQLHSCAVPRIRKHLQPYHDFRADSQDKTSPNQSNRRVYATNATRHYAVSRRQFLMHALDEGVGLLAR